MVSDSEVDLPYMRVFSPRGAGVVLLGDWRSLLSRRRGMEAMVAEVMESDRAGAREAGTFVGGLWWTGLLDVAASSSSSLRFFHRVSVMGRKKVQSKPYCLQCAQMGGSLP